MTARVALRSTLRFAWAVLCACDDTSCPTERPEDGDPCSYASSCNYCVQGNLGVRASCSGARWRLERTTCVAPAGTDECPRDTPRAGTPCSFRGDSCPPYLCDRGPPDYITVMVCSSGSWVPSQRYCDPHPLRPDAAPPDSR